MDCKQYDLTIIGGGPVGIFGSYYGAHRGLRVALVEKNKDLGGMPFYIYPTKQIFDIPGLIHISGLDLTKALLKQLNEKKERISILTNNYPKTIKKENNLFKIELSNRSHIFTKCLLFSQGNGQASPIELDKEIVKGGNVRYIVKDLNEFKNKTVLISGGGDSALDYSFLISKMNKNYKTYLVHRRNTFRGFIDKVNRVSNIENIIIKKPCQIKRIKKEDKSTKVILQTNTIEEQILCDIVLIQHGFSFIHNEINLSNVSLQMKNKKYFTNDFYESSIKQLYIVGILNNKHPYNIIVPFLSSVTIAICHMINTYFDRRSNLY